MPLPVICLYFFMEVTLQVVILQMEVKAGFYMSLSEVLRGLKKG